MKLQKMKTGSMLSKSAMQLFQFYTFSSPEHFLLKVRYLNMSMSSVCPPLSCVANNLI